MQNMTIATDSSVDLTANAFMRKGYSFIGWSTSANGEVEYTDGASYTMGTEQSYTLYAVWETNENTLVFNANGGSGRMANMEISTCETDNLIKNTFTKKGYDFMGWSTTANGNVEYLDQAIYTMGTEDVYTLYAVWEIIEYKITYHINEAIELSSNPFTFTINDLPIAINDLNNKQDFLFDGWYKKSDFSGMPITEITQIGNVDLYGRYIEGSSCLMLEENGLEWTVVGYEGNPISIVVPKKYKGKSVTQMTAGVFAGCSNLESLTIPFLNGHLGNLFGRISYDGSISIDQFYAEHSYNNAYKYYTYYIPENLKNVTITGGTTINIGAFENCRNIESIMLPNTISSIKMQAFYNCGLTSIRIPDSVISIENFVFNADERLTIHCEVESKPSGWQDDWNDGDAPIVWDCNNNDVADDGYVYTVIDDIKYAIKDNMATVVRQARSITTAIILENITYKEVSYPVTRIVDSAFYKCTYLTSVTIPDSVTSIGKYAFYDCDSLTSVRIPDSVTDIGKSAFVDCDSLTSMMVDENNSVYKSVDGNLYSKDGTVFIQYAIGNTEITKFYVPDGVKSIGEYAFYMCKNLKSIEVPYDLTSIGSHAFYGCANLTYAYVPESVVMVGDYAFYGVNRVVCGAASMPSGWSSNWTSSDCEVVWVG